MTAPEGAELSEDGLWWWDGVQWQPNGTSDQTVRQSGEVVSRLSADGRYRWDGTQWEPVEAEADRPEPINWAACPSVWMLLSAETVEEYLTAIGFDADELSAEVPTSAAGEAQPNADDACGDEAMSFRMVLMHLFHNVGQRVRADAYAAGAAELATGLDGESADCGVVKVHMEWAGCLRLHDKVDEADVLARTGDTLAAEIQGLKSAATGSPATAPS